MPRPKRYWLAALNKTQAEGRCRCCGARDNVQAAHIIGRSYDEEFELEDGTRWLFVDPEEIVPLCVTCHADYDQRRLNILPVLTLVEQAAAVRLIGMERALHRVSGQMRVGVDTRE